MAREGCGFTVPWLDLDPARLRAYARGESVPVSAGVSVMYPASILEGVEGRDVLCLASGGGQQSAVFALLGARVTVLDLTGTQLDGDRRAAAHYGYPVTTIQGDMREVGALAEASFDLVYGAPSLCYISDVRPVFGGVAHVLRPGGLYRLEVTNPATEFVTVDSWDGQGYRIDTPYALRRRVRADGAVEFRHCWADLFNGLIGAGLAIQGVYDDPLSLSPTEAAPGSWYHSLTYVQQGMAIVAVRVGPQRGA
jgi:SAM-dependent methyltransferase